MTELNHPFYESHRDAMVAFTRQRLDLAEAMLREEAQGAHHAQSRRLASGRHYMSAENRSLLHYAPSSMHGAVEEPLAANAYRAAIVIQPRDPSPTRQRCVP
jgi:hypothetical protein